MSGRPPASATADIDLEFTQIVARAWQAYHRKTPVWRSCGSLGTKLRVLHLSVYACFSWAGGTPHWTAHELQQVRSLLFRMTRRIARWYPSTVAPDRRSAVGPRAVHVMMALGRARGALGTHMPRASVVSNIELARRFVAPHIRGIHGATRRSGSRLGRGQRMLGHRRWDELIQTVANAHE